MKGGGRGYSTDHHAAEAALGLGGCCCGCIDLLADTRIDEGWGLATVQQRQIGLRGGRRRPELGGWEEAEARKM